jgi:ABC-type uncharacterized transport system fused permease/ATPase subunit
MFQIAGGVIIAVFALIALGKLRLWWNGRHLRKLKNHMNKMNAELYHETKAFNEKMAKQIAESQANEKSTS